MSTARPERKERLHGARDPADVAPRRAFALGCIALFVGCAATTIGCGVSMSTMAALPMRGGWSLSMAWLAMCGRSGPAQLLALLGMWSAMTVAMMLPAIAPNVWRYRCAAKRAGATRPMLLAAGAGAGYLLTWVGVGVAVAVSGTTLATLVLQLPALARAMPLAMGTLLILAGTLQCTAWKSRLLAHCREWPAGTDASPVHFRRAWRCGLRLGRHCIASCAGLTMILLIGGVMDLRTMAVVTTAITAERLLPRAEPVVRVIGVIAMAAGLWQCMRAITGVG